VTIAELSAALMGAHIRLVHTLFNAHSRVHMHLMPPFQAYSWDSRMSLRRVPKETSSTITKVSSMMICRYHLQVVAHAHFRSMELIVCVGSIIAMKRKQRLPTESIAAHWKVVLYLTFAFFHKLQIRLRCWKSSMQFRSLPANNSSAVTCGCEVPCRFASGHFIGCFLKV
jgi:hypothetical protein